MFALNISQKRKKPQASAEIAKIPFGDQKAFHLLNTTRNQFSYRTITTAIFFKGN